MKKYGVTYIILLLLCISFTTAADTPEQSIDRAYQCLESEINNKTSTTLSLQEALFGVLALGSNTKAEQRIEADKNQNCWPKPSCNLKETAQALLSYSRLGKDTAPIADYLASKNGSATGLQWFLMIDTADHKSSTCTLKYKGQEKSISIGEDMKITGDAGSCLTIISTGYWLQIAPACIDNTYEISCTEDFVTTLLYQKTDSDTLYISPQTHSAASSGTTEEQISSKCFKTGAECDYEGSLWAAIALQKAGREISAFTPYLIASAPENEKLFPSAFLYKITSGDDYYSTIVQEQRSSQYWQAAGTRYNKFYDTALALIALSSKTSLEADNAKAYLLQVQTPKGCWNSDNIRDTAFLLYAGWSDHSSTGGPIGNDSGTNLNACSTYGYSCVSSVIDCTDAKGQIFNQYSCTGLNYCCSVPVQEKTCSEIGGVVCKADETCSSSTVSALGGSCCTGTCNPAPSTTQNDCELALGSCKSQCDTGETQTTDSCTSLAQVCCMAAEESEGSSWTWITILVILIILVVLAIVFRKRLQLLLFKLKRPGNVSSTPVTIRRPPFPPSPPSMPQQFAQRPPMQQPAQQRRPAADPEMEETLKKLREMSK